MLLDRMQGEEARQATHTAAGPEPLAALLDRPEDLLDGSSPEVHAAVVHALLAGNFPFAFAAIDSSARCVPPISSPRLTPAEVV